ncbi:YbfB/YjiJ family MFS transporter [Tepidimonas sp.]|uniref:YbfB/YjiJ family MFS transporter n=1 Tax=Tepidimonas sp. TaxID=2002775 RepID=UPI003FCC3BDA
MAVSLGITRFAYGLLLPPMQTDLGWSYLLAGATNTANAIGYLAGALSVPALMRRWGAATVLQAGMALAGLLKKPRQHTPARPECHRERISLDGLGEHVKSPSRNRKAGLGAHVQKSWRTPTAYRRSSLVLVPLLSFTSTSRQPA